ncbi:anti-sigma factor [Bacteroidia bacterium]|nr:anti-sigma factor [Bacteroidia bacterium]GHU83842.1 anti-sigma factor [Bacteroidia bacterium]
MYRVKKDNLKKQIENSKGNLPIDDKVLLDNEFVRQEMESQWENTTDVFGALPDDKQEIWQRISEKIFPQKLHKIPAFIKLYSAAASLLLLIAVGALFLQRNNPEESIVYIVCTGNQDKNILTLDDGTKIKLGAGSRLTYPDKFPSDKRAVELDGQAFFDVAKDAEKPFSVKTGDVVVTAVGTSFEVFLDRRNNTVETILLTGEIKVEYQHRTETVYPDQKLTVSLSTGEVNVQVENADKYSAWRNYNGLDFTNEKLSVIIPRLEYWYGCRIAYDSESILDERFTFKVKNESLDRILDLMYQTAFIRYKKDEENSVYCLYINK